MQAIKGLGVRCTCTLVPLARAIGILHPHTHTSLHAHPATSVLHPFRCNRQQAKGRRCERACSIRTAVSRYVGTAASPLFAVSWLRRIRQVMHVEVYRLVQDHDLLEHTAASLPTNCKNAELRTNR
ncbi:hypothetical protein BaRGS_00002455 [Batillaria attramentaria]|uniref:Secreted protein n=1 Tax=Batillaria attramentaria TaxID=370345 RepID=A0ABD0M4Y8_9CAEN